MGRQGYLQEAQLSGAKQYHWPSSSQFGKHLSSTVLLSSHRGPVGKGSRWLSQWRMVTLKFVQGIHLIKVTSLASGTNSQELNLGLFTPTSELLKPFCSKRLYNPHLFSNCAQRSYVLSRIVLVITKTNYSYSYYQLTVSQALFLAHTCINTFNHHNKAVRQVLSLLPVSGGVRHTDLKVACPSLHS